MEQTVIGALGEPDLLLLLGVSLVPSELLVLPPGALLLLGMLHEICLEPRVRSFGAKDISLGIWRTP